MEGRVGEKTGAKYLAYLRIEERAGKNTVADR